MKKYELLNTDTKIVFEKKLFRIKALISFGDVKEGDIGGYIESEKNLDHSGNAWVYGDAWVYGNARVSVNASLNATTDYFTIGAIGSRNATTTFYKTKGKEIFVACGCFNGSMADFRAKVVETHSGTKHEAHYLKACELAEMMLGECDRNE